LPTALLDFILTTQTCLNMSFDVILVKGVSDLSERDKIRKKYDDLFNVEIAKLQSNCPHADVSEWMEVYWAFGHGTGSFVKECSRCGKVLHRRAYCRQTKGKGANVKFCGRKIEDDEIIRLEELVESGKYAYDDFRYPQKGPDGKMYRGISLQSPVCKECFDAYMTMIKRHAGKLL